VAIDTDFMKDGIRDPASMIARAGAGTPAPAEGNLDSIRCWHTLVEQASRAPSSHNSQPWRFEVVDHILELRADLARRLDVVDPQARELTISCGAALGYLTTAAAGLGWSVALERLPVDAPRCTLARIYLRGRRQPDPHDASRLAALPFRRTNRKRFHARAVPHDVLDCELFAARDDGVSTQIVDDGTRPRLVELIAAGARHQLRDSEFRGELATWLRPKHTGHGDGLPGSVIGLGPVSSRIAPHLLRRLDVGWAIARRDARVARTAPVLAIITSDRDTPAKWLAVGERLAQGLLDLRRVGVWASYFNQPIQVPQLRAMVRRLLNSHAHPQLVLRLGYGPTPPATPRRPLDEVLSEPRPRS
jgi:hypothetical protein